MREILFQGFHPCEDGKQKIKVDGKIIRGEWVEGSLVKYCYGELTESYLKTVHKNTKVLSDKLRYGLSIIDSVYSFPEYDVIPGTVGQYIAKYNVFTGDRCEVSADGGFKYVGTVSWCENCSSYLLTDNTIVYDNGKVAPTNDLCMDAFEDDIWKFKVIGTIYDTEDEE